ncbi:MAG: pro-sigmaK processing inhibitor BofA family protein [Oscillospiraceae bacterium]
MLKWILASVFAVIWIIFLFISIKNKSVKNLCLSMIFGSSCLVALYFFGQSFGIYINLNFFNTLVSLSLGVPGTIFLVLCSKI